MNDHSAAKKIIIPLAVVAALVALVAVSMAYMQGPLPPLAQPDNSVMAGPVTAISPTSITVQKQDGALATLSLAEDIQVTVAGEAGQAGIQKEVGDIKVGMMVLVTPSKSDASAALSVVLLLAPPVQ